MNGDQWLDSKLREIIPSGDEEMAIRRALDSVEKPFVKEGGAIRIAERYPCGSYMKKTMLAGRKEADLALIMVDKPDDKTLTRIENLMRLVPGVRDAKTLWKAVEVQFNDGVHIDVLPVAKQGVTENAELAEQKFKVACNSKPHVQWFIKAAHGTPIHPSTRLIKYLRSRREVWQAVHSFGIEILCVDVLKNFQGNGLSKHVEEVLRQVAKGRLRNGRLLDPVDAVRDLLQGVAAEKLDAITRDAAECVRAIENDSWSSVFAETTGKSVSSGGAPPPPAVNIGGRTLA